MNQQTSSYRPGLASVASSAILASLLAGCGSGGGTPAQSASLKADITASTVTPGHYTVTSVSSGLCLALAGDSTLDGAALQQATCNGSKAQQFDVQLTDDGSYSIINLNSGKSLDVAGISLLNGALLQQWSYGGGPNQRFSIAPKNQAYTISAQNSGKCLDVQNFSTAAGGAIQQWECGNNTNQQWTFTSTDPVLPADPTPTGPMVDASTLDNKLIFGYQGWFACEGDGSPIDVAGNGWRHWAPSATPVASNVTVDMWPDMRDVPAGEQCKTGFTMPDGSPAVVYSSWNRATVNRHFEWMQNYGIDGVLLQQFVTELAPGSVNRRFRDGVTANVRAGASAHGRTWAVEYDTSNAQDADIVKNIKDHWAALAANGSLSAPSYLHQNGLPVVELWGLGFNGQPATPAAANALLDWFLRDAPANQRAYVIGGVPSQWRIQGSDSSQDPAWAAVYRRFDALNPWLVGRFGDQQGVRNFRQNVMAADIAETTRLGKRYMPMLFPGGHNEHRIGGRFWWTQFYEARSAGANTFFGAMFDEVDEATAMYKVAPSKAFLPVEIPTSPSPYVPGQPRGPFITLDADGENLSSDFYLRLAGEASKVLQGKSSLRPDRPISQ